MGASLAEEGEPPLLVSAGLVEDVALPGTGAGVAAFGKISVFIGEGSRVRLGRWLSGALLSVGGGGTITGAGGGNVGEDASGGGNTGVGNGEICSGDVGAAGTPEAICVCPV